MSNINSFPIPTTPFSASVLGLLEAANNLSDVADASTSRTNLGLAIGTDVQAYSADLDTYVANPLTSAELGELQNIGSTTISATQWGYLGAASAFGGSLIDDANAAAARTTLGLAIGTDVQAQSANLQTIANGGTVTAAGIALLDDLDAAAQRVTMGLGSIATQNSNAVSITGGAISGITDLAVADGGTGASDAATARTNLGVPGLADNNTLSGDNTFTGDVDLTNATVIGFTGFDPTSSYNLSGLNVGGNAVSLAALKARSVAGLTGGEVVQLNDGGRSGQFAWVTGNRSANVTADPQQGIWIAPDSAPTGASGAWRRVNIPYVDGWVHVEWFGAVGNGVTDDLPAFQAAVSYIESTTNKLRSGTIAYGAKRYLLNGTLNLGTQFGFGGIKLKGVPPERSGGGTGSTGTGVLLGASTSGPVVLIQDSDISMEDVYIDSTNARSGTKPLSSVSGSGTTATVVTTAAHGLTTGDFVMMTGFTVAGQEDYNGRKQVTVTNSTTFTYPCTATAAVTILQQLAQKINVVRGVQTANCGVQVETRDTAGHFIVRARLHNVIVRNQPGEGFIVSGDVVQSELKDCAALLCGGHGVVFDRGDLTGRTNKFRPGLCMLTNFRSFTTGGHGVCIGTDTSTADRPYRITIQNAELFRNARNSAIRVVEAGTFLNGEQIVVIASAFGGSRDINAAAQPCVAVAGRDLQLLSCRYIESTGSGHVLIKNYGGVTTRMIKVIGGYAAANPGPTNFAFADSGTRQIEIDGVGGEFTDLINDTTLNGLRLTNYKTAFDYTTQYFNAPQDFGGTTITIGAGSAASPNLVFSGDTNTGIFSRAADEVNLAAGGAEIVRASSAGVDIRTGDLLRNGIKVVGAQASAVANVPTGGSATAADNATAINNILVRLRNHGLIAT